MDQHVAERKLAAILCADVAAYSRLMGDDEEQTLRALQESRSLFDELVEAARGRVFGAAGDSVVAEFPSVVDAVECARVVQKTIAERNQDVPEERRMRFRIGLNLGDVLVEGENLYGDGVNVAARVQALADPGGCTISGSVYEQVRNKLDLAFEDLGAREFKNIAEPVHVYRVRLGDEAPENAPSLAGAMAAAALPSKPSIAVLPFENLGGGSDEEAFVDGLTEDVITELSRFQELLVSARNSVFTYKGKPAKVQQVSQDLNVRYVLEGSVRRVGDRVRVNAQLIEATGGHHLWAERFDRDLDDIFALQDELTQRIVGQVATKLDESERRRVRGQKETANPQAYDLVLQGREQWLRFTPETNLEARELYQRAAELDPDYARAHAGLAWTYLMEYGEQWSEDRDATHAEALAHARRAVDANPASHSNYLTLGQVYLWGDEHEKAAEAFERGVALNPNDADGYAFLAQAVALRGEGARALELLNKALSINPTPPPWHRSQFVMAHFAARDYDAAVAAMRALDNPPMTAYRWTIAALGHLARPDEAKPYVEKYMHRYPDFTISDHGARLNFKHDEDRAHYLEGLRLAGMPA